jgi:hypothetical protein
VARTQDLIATAYERFVAEVPALDKLKLLARLELRGRGDVQVFGIRAPGPEIIKGEPTDPRVDIAIARSHFNELAAEGKLSHWVDAYDRGEVKVTGDSAVVALLGNVIQRRRARV